MTDNQHNNTESEGIFKYGKNISCHSPHWIRKNELDGELYASLVSTFEDCHSVQRLFAIQVRIICVDESMTPLLQTPAAIDIGQHDQTNDQLVFEPLVKEMTRHPSLRSIQEVIGTQVASSFLRELGTLFWRPLTESEHCASCCEQQPKTLGNLEASTPISGNSLRNKFHRLEALTQIDKAREYDTIDALTSWYIQDLLVVKEDIE